MGTANLQPNVRHAAANIGMAIFIASWGMVFVTFIFAYAVMRTHNPVWPPLDTAPLPVGLAWLNTGVLLASSVTYQRGQRALEHGDHGEFNRLLAFTLGLGLLFLGLQATLWSRVHADGLTISGPVFGSWLYFLTVFHAVHIVVGLGLLGALVPRALGHRLYPHDLLRAKLSGMFWHFLDVAWIGIFLTVFIL